MSSLIIINSDNQMEVHKIQNTLTTIGNSSDHDIYLNCIEGAGISILKEADHLVCCLNDPKLKKLLKGAWNKKIKDCEILLCGEIKFILNFQQFEKKNEGQLQDWNFSNFPKNPLVDSYPDDLLSFILETIFAEQGAILHKVDNHLRTLVKRNLNIKNKAEFFLNSLLEENANKEIVQMNFDTHTLLFEAGLTPLDFIMVRSKISKREEIILYLPRPKSHLGLPKGMIHTLFHLCTQGLSAYLINKINKKLSRMNNKKLTSEMYWGESAQMQRLKIMTDKLASTNLSLFINGETGVGKEMLAKYIRKISNTEVMVSVNCAAIPQNLAESFLFGHVKGAFTGADRDQKGKITQANGGILFLDEIGELDLEIQAKLLRVLQDGIVQPVGGREQKVQIRILSASHKKIIDLIHQGRFREDLYFRLNEATLEIPALRERNVDIPVLSAFFLKQVLEDNNLPEKLFDQSSLILLKNFSWPGNLRQLRSIIRKVAILSDEEIITAENVECFLQDQTGSSRAQYPLNLKIAKKQFIDEHIQRAIKASHGNKTKAAKILGITPRNLFRLLAEESTSEINVLEDDKNVISNQLNH